MSKLKDFLNKGLEQQRATVTLDLTHAPALERQQVYETLERERIHASSTAACSPLVRWARGEAFAASSGVPCDE